MSDEPHPVWAAIVLALAILWEALAWIFPIAAGAALWFWWKG